MPLPSSSGWAVRLVTRAYHSLLILYPADFRAQYEQEMQDIFEKRCLELYQMAGTEGIGRWLLKIMAGEAISIYKEYLEMTADLFEDNEDTRRILTLGILFLAGTWMALFFVVTPFGGAARFVPGTILVLSNALLVARSLTRSEHIEFIAGMAAMTNTILIAGLMAVQASLGSPHLATILVQVVLTGLHGLLLWRLRGEDLTRELRELETGE